MAPNTDAMPPSSVPMTASPAPATDVNSPPRTYEHRFSVTLDVANVLWRANRGYDLFSTDDASWRIAIGAGYDVLKLPHQMVLALDIGGMFEPGQGSNNSSGLLGDSLRASVSGSTVLLAGSLRWSVLPWLSPYGRLQVVASRYNIDIHTGGGDSASGASGGEWVYHKAAGGGALGAGLMLNLPPRNPVNVGVLLEGGYWLQQSVDLVLQNGEVPTGSIPVAGATLGTLGNSGPYLRFAGVLRF